ncbi:transposase [Rhodobacter sp. NTK016B]|uniref:transposase n=1 Tax=Rhodobacter sp. NTK016B TaxID=2759676 RepID=UPI0039C989EC
MPVDCLKGLPETITAAFPRAAVRTGTVHLVRHNARFYAWKDCKFVPVDLHPIYRSLAAEQPAGRLDAFQVKCAGRYRSIAPGRRRAWQEMIPFFACD